MSNQSLPWFRMYTDFFNEPKIASLSFEDQRHFIGVLALKADGVIGQDCEPQLMDRIVARCLWLGHAEIERVKSRLVAAQLIDGLWDPIGRRRFSTRGDDSGRPPASEWNAIRERIFQRDDYTCSYCGERAGLLECDHILPVSRGGCHSDSNLTTACRSCNRSKNNLLVSEWRGAV